MEHTCIPQLALNNIPLRLTFKRRDCIYKTAAATLCIQYTLRYAVLSARAHTIPDRPAMVPHCSPCSPPSIPSRAISKVRFNTDLIRVGQQPQPTTFGQHEQTQSPKDRCVASASDTVYGGGCVFILYYFCSARADKTHLIDLCY